MESKSIAAQILDDGKTIDLYTKKLAEAIKSLEMISILGDAEWKKLRAKQALIDIERIKK